MNLYMPSVNYRSLLSTSNQILGRLAKELDAGEMNAASKICDVAAFQRFIWDYREELGLIVDTPPKP